MGDVRFYNKYSVTNDGVKLFSTHSTPNADWTSHWLANDTPFIYNIALIKKRMDPSFYLLLVDFDHPDALDSRMRMQQCLLFPQWHLVVNYLDI